MKKIFAALAIVAITMTASVTPIAAQSITDVLGSVKGVVEDLTASKNFKITDIAGTWSYSAPAVSMKGDNALKNIGGSAAATQLEKKLEPYYKKVGFNNITIVINTDSTFTMELKKVKLSGQISKDDEGLIFTFDKMKSHPVRCIATKSGSKLNLTFDASKLLSVIEGVTKVVNISSLKAISGILSSYDGLYIGFQLNKTAEADGSAPKAGILDTLTGAATGGTDTATDTVASSSDGGSKAASVLGGLLKGATKKK